MEPLVAWVETAPNSSSRVHATSIRPIKATGKLTNSKENPTTPTGPHHRSPPIIIGLTGKSGSPRCHRHVGTPGYSILSINYSGMILKLLTCFNTTPFPIEDPGTLKSIDTGTGSHPSGTRMGKSGTAKSSRTGCHRFHSAMNGFVKLLNQGGGGLTEMLPILQSLILTRHNYPLKGWAYPVYFK